MDVFVAGGTGFVGRSLCRVLVERGHDVTAASRSPDDAAVPSGVATVALDVAADDPRAVDDPMADDPDDAPATHDGLAAHDAVAGHDAVVNLVALPSHLNRPGRSHEAVHLGGTRTLLAASEAADSVERFVQLSALGAGRDLDVAYFRAKDRAEAAVRDADLDAVIYRPSVVFGDGAGFEAFLRRVTPPLVTPLPAARTLRVQPIWVEDLAPLLADGVDDERHVGETYDVGGPARLSLAEVVRLLCGGPVIVPVPDLLARAGFALAEVVPAVPLGTDQYRLLQQDNTTDDNDVGTFGVAEADLTTLAEYVGAAPSAASATSERATPERTR